VRSIAEIIGRTDWLRQSAGVTVKQSKLDLAPLLGTGLAGDAPACAAAPIPDSGLALRIAADTKAAVESASGGEFAYAIRNTDRAIGARLSGDVARRHGDQGMANTPIKLRLGGAAGQSLGAGNAGGVHIVLDGEANAGVGKGMAGGRIVVRPPHGAAWPGHESAIVGNTCLYGATGGELYAAGRAGERFGVRNSGALAVVEGVGDHCCEYMTGGSVVVLGRCGVNFGAGMTGGYAFVFDEARDFVDRYNHELVDITRISHEGMENYWQHLRSLLLGYVDATGSAWGRRIVDEFRELVHKFWLVKPKAASLDSLADELRRAA